MTIYITISHSDHRRTPVYSKVTATPEKVRGLINWAVDWYNGRCYHSRGKYLKLFMDSTSPLDTMDCIKQFVKEGTENAKISDCKLAKL